MAPIRVNHEEQKQQLFLLIPCSFQRLWPAGASSLTAPSPVCCSSLWSARLDPAETKVCCSSESVPECDDCVFACGWWYVVPLSVESYNLLVTSTIEMAVVYRSDPLCRCLQEALPVLTLVCDCVPVQGCPAEWVVPACVPLRERPVGRRGVCSGHRPGLWWAEGGPAGNVRPGDAPLSFLHLSHLMMMLTVPWLDCRSFSVTSSSQWRTNQTDSSSCSGGGASKVRCCPSPTWTWQGMVWESWLFSPWRGCTSYRFVLHRFAAFIIYHRYNSQVPGTRK